MSDAGEQQSIVDFLLGLGKDPHRALALKEDPEKVLDEAGVTGDAREAILSADPVRIHQLITEALTAGGHPSPHPKPKPGPPAPPGPPGPPGPPVVVVVIAI
jgi:hypothetical protein